MGSIITNQGAMVALQTLRTIQQNLTTTQSEMSTGKRVNDARDNASVWSVASSMNYDVNNFNSVIDGLKATKSAVDTALTAANNIVTSIGNMATLVAGYDPTKVSQSTDINNQLTAINKQIDAYISGASFNGLNVLSLAGNKSVLASLDRSSGTTVAPSKIELVANDLKLSKTAPIVSTSVQLTTDGTITTLSDHSAITLSSSNSYAAFLSIGGDNATTTPSTATTSVSAIDSGVTTTLTIDGKSVSYTAPTYADGSSPLITAATIASSLKSGFDALGITDLQFTVTTNATTGAANLKIENINTNTSTRNISVTSAKAQGNLGFLSTDPTVNADYTTNTNTLASLNSTLSNAQSVASKLGTLSNRLQLQADFVTKLADSLKTGIGSMTDADMEATAARLQALQVQQQLGVQALSIANAQPQTILSLFRNNG